MGRSGRAWQRAIGGAVLVITAFSTPVAGQDALGESSSSVELRQALQLRLEAARATGELFVDGRPILARRSLLKFYEDRGFSPAWTSAPQERIRLAAAVNRAWEHGLTPSDYLPLQDLDSYADVDRELLLTNAFLLLGSHLLHGRVNPESVVAEWVANRRQRDMAAVLESALARRAVDARLEELAPVQPRYRRLKAAYTRLVRRDEPFSMVAGGPTLREGDSGPRVAAVIARLKEAGLLPARFVPGSGPDGPVMGPVVTEGVRSFQARWGLDEDGVVGEGTLAALNVDAGTLRNRLRVNLERWRWLPDTLGTRHVEVNIAGYSVTVVERGRAVMSVRAIVGRPYRETPMFSNAIQYLVLSPYWHVPPSIAVRDKLPEIKKNPGYLSSQRMVLFEQATNRVVDPSEVDWSLITASNFNRLYRLRQDPGPQNALGRVKFMFPNPHNVYLHDTPGRELFSRANRAFSSGCIRIERPLDLAEYLLADQPAWPRARIDQVADAGLETTIRLRSPIPVHLLYWTAWVDDEGELRYRGDLYGRDDRVLAALDSPPPRA